MECKNIMIVCKFNENFYPFKNSEMNNRYETK